MTYGKRKCMRCGKEFEAQYASQTTCSLECKKDWKRFRNRQYKSVHAKKTRILLAENLFLRQKCGLPPQGEIEGVDYEAILKGGGKKEKEELVNHRGKMVSREEYERLLAEDLKALEGEEPVEAEKPEEQPKRGGENGKGPKRCPACGKEFNASGPRQVFCSIGCRKKFNDNN